LLSAATFVQGGKGNKELPHLLGRQR